MILVSACLLGLNTKYNGKSNANELLIRYSSFGKFLPVCPEQLGGLPTPRDPSEITPGCGDEVLLNSSKVLSQKGYENTAYFISGAQQVLCMARLLPVSAAILKENSPSCGVNNIYDGTFTNRLKTGSGVTASILKKQSIQVYSEKEITEELLKKLLENDNTL